MFITCGLFPVSVDTNKYYYKKKSDFSEILFPKAPLIQETSGAAKLVKLIWGEEPRVVGDSLFRGPLLQFGL